MLKFFRNQLDNKKGFSLVELIVVIAILGVIALIAVPNVMSYLNQAKVTADKTTAASLAKGIQTSIALNSYTDTDFTSKFNGKAIGKNGDATVNGLVYVQNIANIAPQSVSGSSFYISGTTDTIKIGIGTSSPGTQVYP